MSFLYKHWAKAGGIAALFITLLLIFNSKAPIGSPIWFFWMLLPLYLVHQFEEYVWPGGFKDEVNNILMKRPSCDFPINDQRAFLVNILYIWIYVPVCAIISFKAVIFPVSALVFSTINGLLHLGAGLLRRKYNPGLLASLFLNVPFGLYVIFNMINNKLITSSQLIVGTFLGFILHAMMIVYFIIIKNTKVAG